jgi:hypothetical protein
MADRENRRDEEQIGRAEDDKIMGVGDEQEFDDDELDEEDEDEKETEDM